MSPKTKSSARVCQANEPDARPWAEDLRASLTFFLTTEHVRDLLHFAAGDGLAQARYWLRARRVPFIQAGKRKVYRREDVIAALEAAVEYPGDDDRAAEAGGRNSLDGARRPRPNGERGERRT